VWAPPPPPQIGFINFVVKPYFQVRRDREEMKQGNAD
jgi:hypothetical protein